jgi:hypothetical protein
LDETAMIAQEAPTPKPAPSSDLPNEPLPKTPAKQIPRFWEAVRAGAAMIAKRIVRERGASNFRRLGRYILDGAAEEEQAVMMARMADYILGAEKSRAANVRFSNCVSTDAELALKEILATQALNKRAKGDRTYHLVISFPPGERPTLSQLEDIERVLVKRIGLGGHQRLSATHLDTGHLHLHVAINKIHPESFRSVEPYYDKRRLMQACMELEAKHGLIPTAHGALANVREATRTARETMLALLRSDILRKALTNPGPQTWDELHRVLREQGLELRLRGAGLVFQNTAGAVRVKASSIARELSLMALTDRLGPYKASAGADEAVSRIPARGIGGSASLYQRYAAERAAATSTQQANKALEAFKLVKASYVRQARAIAEDRALTNVGKRAAYREFRKRRQAAFYALREQLRTQVSAKTSGAPFPSWPAYVRSQAALGDAEAIVLLQRWRTRSKRRDPSPPRNAPSDPHGAKSSPQAPSRLHNAAYQSVRMIPALPASKMQRRPASRRASRR